MFPGINKDIFRNYCYLKTAKPALTLFKIMVSYKLGNYVANFININCDQ